MSVNRDSLTVTPTMLAMARVFAADVVEQIQDELTAAGLPVAHAITGWQRLLGRFGIPSRALCGERIVAGRAGSAGRRCRECVREAHGVLAGEVHRG